MPSSKEKIMVINRSFWPVYSVIGEALLRFSEKQVDVMSVGVILQDHADIRTELKKHDRGHNVKFFPCRAWSVSESGVLRRILDAVFFMVWVFLVLLWQRPTKVYISTDPPVVVPFIVLIYSKLFSAKYIYHLQDIHPEAANVVLPMNAFIYKTLQFIDSLVMRHAQRIITITDEMAFEIGSRSMTKAEIFVLSNPAVAFDKASLSAEKKAGFTFCGNAGRLQRMPLLIDAIDLYCNNGGALPFIFAGAGVYSKSIEILANKHNNVVYKGLISAEAAALLNTEYAWALLPIEDDVTRFAFPSKSSSYVYSGAYIAAICGGHTSVAQWVVSNKLGCVVSPNVNDIKCFFDEIEHNKLDVSLYDDDRVALKIQLSFDVFVDRLVEIIC
jgi:hypothetical protein